MRRTWAARAAVLTTLFTVLMMADAVRGANVYDWMAARQKAERASSPRDKESAWGNLAYTDLRLARYYRELAVICAQAQIGIAERRTAYDKSAAAAAAHAFIVTGRFDSAAVWAGRDPALKPLQQFAQAHARGESFSYSGASGLDLALAGLHVASDPSELKGLAGQLGTSSPVAALFAAIINDDAASLPAATAKVEDLLDNPPGVDNPVLEQFGDPLVYSALARAHARMAVAVCRTAAADASAASVPAFRFLSGLARYAVGDYDGAQEDLRAATGGNVDGIANAYLAGIEWRNGDRAKADDLAQKCLAAEKKVNNGESLVALARVESEMTGSRWGTGKAAASILKDEPDSRILMYAAYWTTALLAGDAHLDSAKEMYWLAAGKLKPDVRHNFPNIYCSPQELFCADYISALADGGARGNGLDYLDAFNGLMELAKFIPATKPLKEGLRWLALATNDESVPVPRR